MPQFTRSLAAVFALSLLASPALADDLVDNPAYQSWATCKPGSTLTRTSEGTMGGVVIRYQIASKLVELTAEKAVVDIVIRSLGPDMKPEADSPADKRPAKRTEILARVKKEDVQRPDAVPAGVKGQTKVLPDEDVTVAGKTYKCQVVQFAGESQGTTVSGAFWTCPTVPGQLVKMEEKFGGAVQGTAKMTLTAVDLK